MTHHSTEQQQGDIVLAMRALGQSIEALARWPWSSARRAALITALNTVLELHVSRIGSQASQIVAGPLETVKRQQGRHVEQLARLEARIAVLEADRARAVGGGRD